MWNARHALISSRCAWCDQVWTGTDWISERRPSGREIYSHGICLACAARHFPAGRGRNNLAVERFKMEPPLGGQAPPSPSAGRKPRLAEASSRNPDE